MIEVRRENLEEVSRCIDVHNPKSAFNYLYADSEYIVATNTKVLGRYKHEGFNGEPFYVAKKLIDTALKHKSSVNFGLSANKVVAYDKDGREVMTYSISEEFTDTFADYNRIVKKEFKESRPFADPGHIAGIFAAERINVNPKFMPKIKHGYIRFNEPNIPVMITDNEGLEIVVMPITDGFPEFQ